MMSVHTTHICELFVIRNLQLTRYSMTKVRVPNVRSQKGLENAATTATTTTHFQSAQKHCNFSCWKSSTVLQNTYFLFILNILFMCVVCWLSPPLLPHFRNKCFSLSSNQEPGIFISQLLPSE